MTYFKIIKDDAVVSVGCVFLKWNPKKKRMFVCDVDEGQFVQTYNEQNIYTDSWLKPAPIDAEQHELADVVIIEQTEYEDIIAMLEEGEEILVEQEPEPTVEVHEIQEESEEKPMTIAEMRAVIIEQQKQIDILMQKLNN